MRALIKSCGNVHMEINGDFDIAKKSQRLHMQNNMNKNHVLALIFECIEIHKIRKIKRLMINSRYTVVKMINI